MDKPKRGRPKKADIEAKKKRSIVGRPPGEAARIQELKARLLATTGDRVINKIVEISMNDEHPGQIAALKMCMERLLPVSMFEKDAKSGRASVQINISGLSSGVETVTRDNTIDVEVTDVEVNN